jgi:hypothetical protein
MRKGYIEGESPRIAPISQIEGGRRTRVYCGMRDTLPLRLMLATATLVLGVQGALGVWFTWASGYDLSDTGFMYGQGLLAFGGAVGLAG